MYHGGKSRTAPVIARNIHVAAQGRTRYLEPFVGGANVLATVPQTWQRTAADTHLDLILMWKAIQTGWLPPAHVSRETYEALKDAPPSPLRGFAGYACSWGAKWFGGYGTNGRKLDLAEASHRWITHHAHRLRGVTFTVADYTSWHPGPDTVVYCDPPYDGTTGYHHTFDTDKFWYTCEQWVNNGAVVLVSEYTAPDPWIKVRTRTRYTPENRTSHTPEHLWRHPGEHQPALGDSR